MQIKIISGYDFTLYYYREKSGICKTQCAHVREPLRIPVPLSSLDHKCRPVKRIFKAIYLLSSQWARPKLKENTLEQNEIH